MQAHTKKESLSHEKHILGFLNALLMKKVILILCAFLGLAGCRSSQNANLDNSTVPTLDVERFMGRWYEIARYEHRFEKDMTHVTATYTLQDDGKIEVLNEGTRDGERKQAKGRAKQPDANDPGKLKVSFFLFFYSDYYIMDIDPDYRYALIGSSTDKYLWILSRDKQLPQDVLDSLLAQLRRRGYDTDRLVFVRQ